MTAFIAVLAIVTKSHGPGKLRLTEVDNLFSNMTIMLMIFEIVIQAIGEGAINI